MFAISREGEGGGRHNGGRSHLFDPFESSTTLLVQLGGKPLVVENSNRCEAELATDNSPFFNILVWFKNIERRLKQYCQ